MTKQAYRLFDYTTEKRRWGHDIIHLASQESNEKLNIMGFGKGIKEGDVIIVGSVYGTTGTAGYLVEKISYLDNPADMWNADVSFISGSKIDEENSILIPN
jgi:hypothetical protein